MWELLTATQNSAFTLSMMLVIGIGLVEAFGLVSGFYMCGALESWLPDLAYGSESGSLSKLYSWLNVGRVPILMLIIMALTLFAVSGFILQCTSKSLTHAYMPAALANGLAFCLTIPALRFFTAQLQRIMPKDESQAVSEDSFIGRSATITFGEANMKRFAEAKLKDEFGKTHYVQVYPDRQEETFHQGESILIVRREGPYYFGIMNQQKNGEKREY
jgi:hypothetical protein